MLLHKPNWMAFRNSRSQLASNEDIRLEDRILGLRVSRAPRMKRDSIPCPRCRQGQMYQSLVGEECAVHFRCERRDCRFVCDRPVIELPDQTILSTYLSAVAIP